MARRITLPTLLLIAAFSAPAAAQTSSGSGGDAWLIESSTQDSLENAQTNQTTVWQNPDTGSSGAITPVQTYQSDAGEYCREYQKTVTIGGKQQQAYGTACRTPDGDWQIVGSEAAEPPATTVVYRDRVVYEPVYEPVYAPAPRPYYGYPVFPIALNFGFGFYDDYWGGHYRGHHRRYGHYRGGHGRYGHNRGGRGHNRGHGDRSRSRRASRRR